MELIGENKFRNDWNKVTRQAGLNAWIGKLADGTVAAVQTMPWDYKPWGCGTGLRGSCNNGWIQFEICEDDLSNKAYFDAVYKEACELTAYLCKLYGLNPKGTVNYKNTTVPVILCHQDSFKLNLGSNHADIYHWFNKYGKTMEDVRADVAKIMGETANTPVTPTPGDNRFLVKITCSVLNVRAGAGTNYKVNTTVKKGEVFTIVDTKTNGSTVWGKLKSGAGWISLKYTKRV
jgi:hypothetical protein